MRKRNYTVQELLEITSLWCREGDHFEVTFIDAHGSGSQQVTDAELAQRHPNLPIGLAAWCDMYTFGPTKPHTNVRAQPVNGYQDCIVRRLLFLRTVGFGPSTQCNHNFWHARQRYG
jgi:hypothetical protein